MMTMTIGAACEADVTVLLLAMRQNMHIDDRYTAIQIYLYLYLTYLTGMSLNQLWLRHFNSFWLVILASRFLRPQQYDESREMSFLFRVSTSVGDARNWSRLAQLLTTQLQQQHLVVEAVD